MSWLIYLEQYNNFPGAIQPREGMDHYGVCFSIYFLPFLTFVLLFLNFYYFHFLLQSYLLFITIKISH